MGRNVSVQLTKRASTIPGRPVSRPADCATSARGTGRSRCPMSGRYQRVRSPGYGARRTRPPPTHSTRWLSLSRSTPGRKPKRCGRVFGGSPGPADGCPSPCRIVWFTTCLKERPNLPALSLSAAARSSSRVSVVRMGSIMTDVHRRRRRGNRGGNGRTSKLLVPIPPSKLPLARRSPRRSARPPACPQRRPRRRSRAGAAVGPRYPADRAQSTPATFSASSI